MRESSAPRLIRALSNRASLVTLGDGRQYVVKPICQTWNGCRVVNVEAEWVAWQLFRAAAVCSPAVTVIEWPGAPCPHLGSRYLPHAHAAYSRCDLPPTRVDAEAVCRLLVLDAIIGNVDRHLANLLFTRPTRGRRWIPVAIDHGLSMVSESVATAAPLIQNFTAGIDGQSVTSRATRWETRVAQQQGTLRRLWRCQALLELAANLGPKGISTQTELVRQLVSERVIRSIVHAMPDDVVYERPARTRKDELSDILLSRRTAIRAGHVVEHIERTSVGKASPASTPDLIRTREPLTSWRPTATAAPPCS
jgi:hypothetical protein